MSKAQIVLIWGASLMAVQAWTDGDIPALYSEVINGSGNRPAGMGLRLIGQGLFIALLAFIANFSDDAATMSLVLLGGLTLVFVMDNQATVNGLLSMILGWAQSGNAPPGPVGGHSPGLPPTRSGGGGKK